MGPLAGYRTLSVHLAVILASAGVIAYGPDGSVRPETVAAITAVLGVLGVVLRLITTGPVPIGTAPPPPTTEDVTEAIEQLRVSLGELFAALPPRDEIR